MHQYRSSCKVCAGNGFFFQKRKVKDALATLFIFLGIAVAAFHIGLFVTYLRTVMKVNVDPTVNQLMIFGTLAIFYFLIWGIIKLTWYLVQVLTARSERKKLEDDPQTQLAQGMALVVLAGAMMGFINFSGVRQELIYHKAFPQDWVEAVCAASTSATHSVTSFLIKPKFVALECDSPPRVSILGSTILKELALLAVTPQEVGTVIVIQHDSRLFETAYMKISSNRRHQGNTEILSIKLIDFETNTALKSADWQATWADPPLDAARFSSAREANDSVMASAARWIKETIQIGINPIQVRQTDTDHEHHKGKEENLLLWQKSDDRLFYNEENRGRLLTQLQKYLVDDGMDRIEFLTTLFIIKDISPQRSLLDANSSDDLKHFNQVAREAVRDDYLSDEEIKNLFKF